MRIRTVRALAAVLAVAACTPAATTTPVEQPAPRPGAPTNAEIEAIYRARQDSARMRFTEADVGFMQGMIHHHAQAVEMSLLAPTHTTTPALRTLAARIINAQKDEIESMQTWLRDRDRPVPEMHITDSGVMVHGADHSMHMPGMLSAAQMRELAAARGAEFDRLFLTYMIQHHRGAVTMVHDLFATDGAGQDEAAFKLASDVQVDQLTEIARMELMLSEMTGGPSR
jgi:uncharacterized protein (DUF305 family)